MASLLSTDQPSIKDKRLTQVSGLRIVRASILVVPNKMQWQVNLVAAFVYN
jgi:capsular polysaccharide biosynthesis protein